LLKTVYAFTLRRLHPIGTGGSAEKVPLRQESCRQISSVRRAAERRTRHKSARRETDAANRCPISS